MAAEGSTASAREVCPLRPRSEPGGGEHLTANWLTAVGAVQALRQRAQWTPRSESDLERLFSPQKIRAVALTFSRTTGTGVDALAPRDVADLPNAALLEL